MAISQDKLSNKISPHQRAEKNPSRPSRINREIPFLSRLLSPLVDWIDGVYVLGEAMTHPKTSGEIHRALDLIIAFMLGMIIGSLVVINLVTQ